MTAAAPPTAPAAAEPAPAAARPDPPAAASDAPRRVGGTRVRSGNAMQRGRAAVLDAAAHCVERYGVRRTTMGDIALKAAVAKATLYNHFRTKDDVLAALAASRVADLAQTCEAVAAGRPDAPPDAGRGLAAALEVAAAALATSGPLRRVVADEPSLAARLASPDDGRGWAAARSAVRAVLTAAGADDGDAAVDLVLRWLTSQVHWPAEPAAAARGAALLVAAVSRPEAAAVDRPVA